MSRKVRSPWLVPWFAILIAQAAAQSPSDASRASTPQKFDVASIRPSGDRPGPGSWIGIRTTGDSFEAHGMSLKSLVGYAYAFTGPQRQLVAGGGGWIDSQNWDIIAKVDDPSFSGLSNKERIDRMVPLVKALLEERFHVKLHTELRSTPVYALVQAKGGAKVKEVPAPAEILGDSTEAIRRYFEENPGKAFPGGFMCSGDRCTANAATIAGALGQIQYCSHADRMVVDETGLKGHYDFSFRMTRKDDDDAMGEVMDDLGMKLEPRKMDLTTYVIDSAEKPSPN